MRSAIKLLAEGMLLSQKDDEASKNGVRVIAATVKRMAEEDREPSYEEQLALDKVLKPEEPKEEPKEEKDEKPHRGRK